MRSREMNFTRMFKEGKTPYNVMGVTLDLKAEDITDEGKFKGWGSTFGGKADAHGDVIVEGAFKDTINNGGRNGNGVAMLWQHNPYKPIGTWTMLEERKRGLYVEGELVMEVQQAKEAHALMKSGAMKGLSIGYDLPRLANGMRDPDSYEIVEKGDSYVRFLKKIELWEISPVTFPANIRANITTVKDFENCMTPRDWENALREAGLSKQSAQLVVKQMNLPLRESKDNSSEVEDLILAELMKRNSVASDF